MIDCYLMQLDFQMFGILDGNPNPFHTTDHQWHIELHQKLQQGIYHNQCYKSIEPMVRDLPQKQHNDHSPPLDSRGNLSALMCLKESCVNLCYIGTKLKKIR